MKSLTIIVAAVSALAFATTASACPFMSKTKDKQVEAPIIKPKTS